MICSEEQIWKLVDKKGRRVRLATQRRILTEMGIAFKERPDGSLVVLQAAVDSALGAPASRPKAEPEPNFGAR